VSSVGDAEFRTISLTNPNSIKLLYFALLEIPIYILTALVLALFVPITPSIVKYTLVFAGIL